MSKWYVCQDLTGELSNSLSEIRKETHSWKTKWRHVFVKHKPKSSTVVCCHERELCGFVHGDDFIFTGDSVQLMWIESRLKERLNFEQCADLGIDDGDRMVTILNRLFVDLEHPERNRGSFAPSRLLACGRVWMDSTSALSCAMGARSRRHIKEFDCAKKLGGRDTRASRSWSSSTSTS